VYIYIRTYVHTHTHTHTHTDIYLPPSSAEIKDGWSYTSTPLCFHGTNRENFLPTHVHESLNKMTYISIKSAKKPNTIL
jgi:hypothetical protein